MLSNYLVYKKCAVLCSITFKSLKILIFLLSFSFSTACSPGTFKSKQGEGFCLPCPANSRASSGASSVCSCRNGYYRSDTDSPDSACTSKQILLSTDFAIACLKVKMLLFKLLKIVYFLNSQKNVPAVPQNKRLWQMFWHSSHLKCALSGW